MVISIFFDPLWVRFHDQYEHFKKLGHLYKTVLKSAKNSELYAETCNNLANVCLMLAEYAESVDSKGERMLNE